MKTLFLKAHVKAHLAASRPTSKETVGHTRGRSRRKITVSRNQKGWMDTHDGGGAPSVCDCVKDDYNCQLLHALELDDGSRTNTEGKEPSAEMVCTKPGLY